jgi:transcriptional regulator with XRE-family HTH domain
VKAVHNLSKEAREEIISILLANRNKKALAEELGVTPAAITKFASGRTHPSDETLLRALEIADEEERRKILQVIVNDLITSLMEVIEDNPKVAEEKIDDLKRVVDELEKKRLTSLGFV